MKTITARLPDETLSQIEYIKLFLTEKYGIKITSTHVIKKSIDAYYQTIYLTEKK